MIEAFMEKIIKFISERNMRASDFFALFLSSFIFSNAFTVLSGDFTSLEYVATLSQASFWIVLIFVAAILCTTVVVVKSPIIVNWALLMGSIFYSLLLCIEVPGSLYFNIGIALVLVFIIRYVTAENRLGIDMCSISKRCSLIITVIMFIIFVALVSYWTIRKYLTFSHGSFDFGIFTQMFEQMAKTGLPFTTVERSRYLSHFAVHFSPVYYLILPGYYIFRSPEYLLVMQAAVVGAGAFAVRSICLKLDMSPASSTAAAALYLLFPTMANGCFYDFHENKFLSVFLLYMIYFILCNKNLGIIIFALLTLSVKEDAAIYVMAVALWMILTNRKRLTAVFIFAVSVLYFVFACKMIQVCGGEIMMSRLENYYADPNGGFIDVIKTCFYNIGFLIKEVFIGANVSEFSEITYAGQKLEFVLWLCIPLLFTPFTSKHTTHLVLLIPLLVINLMPEWMYQYNVDYQYTYGTAALMIGSALITLSEKSPETRKRLLTCALVLSIVFTTSLVHPKATRYFNRYNKEDEVYKATEEVLDMIPHDASVTAYGFFIPHLSYIDDLHTSPDYYADYVQTDYYVIDTRYDDSHTARMYLTMDDDYELVAEGGFAKLYKKVS